MNHTNAGSEVSLKTLIAGLVAAAILLMSDMVLDAAGLYDRFHIWFEAGSLAGILSLLIYVARLAWQSGQVSMQLRRTIGQNQAEIDRLQSALVAWQTQNQALVQTFADKLDEQCTLWGLTEAEKSVARALLLGHSLKVIARDRGTSDATVRQQASEIYRKSNLQGRTELSAWFLKHLL